MKRFGWGLVFILFAANVLSLGITPANRQLDFEPGTEKSIAYRIYNTEQKEFTAHLNISGTLKPYLELDQEEIAFTKDDKVKSFTLKVRFPQAMPADASAKIDIIGVPKDASSTLTLSASLGVMGATGAVVDDVKVEEEPEIPEENTTSLLPIVLWLAILMVAGNVVFFTYRRFRSNRLPELSPPDFKPPTQNMAVQQSSTQAEMEPAPQPTLRGLYFADGSPVKSVSELLYFVQNVPEEVFASYVNPQSNEVAMWLDGYLKEPKLALRVYDSLNRQEIMQALNFHLMQAKAQEEQQRHAAELRSEIERLKADLDFI